MISCDTKQQFSRVACGCGRTIDPGGRHGGTTGRDVDDDDDDDDVVHVSARPTDRQTTRDNAIYMHSATYGELASRHACAGRIVDVTRCRCDCDQRLDRPVARSM